MDFSFRHPTGFHESEYDLVEALSDADFAVVDADSQPAVKGVMQSGRVAQSVFVGSQAPAGAASHLLRPIDPVRILRTLDALTMRRDEPDTERDSLCELPVESPRDWALPTLDDVVSIPAGVVAAHEEPAPTLPSPSTLPASGASPGLQRGADPASRAAHAAAKAAARAAARRARQLSEHPAGAAATEPLRDVLVFDADPQARAALCGLLALFGFEPVPVASASQVAAELAARPYAAIFLDIVLDDTGVALLRVIRELPASREHREPAVLMLAGHLDPADRVTAALAGLPEPLIKPLSRGQVARALESCGVTLPADARRF